MVKKKWLYILGTILGVVILFLGFVLVYQLGKEKGFQEASEYQETQKLLEKAQLISVPDLKGMSLAEAQKIVEGFGWELAIKGEEYSESIPPRHVINQSPEAGFKVKKKSKQTIWVVLSKQETVRVPNLIGESINEANLILKKSGLVLGKIERISNDEVEEIIIRQSPKPGAEVEKGSPIDVSVR